MNKLLYILTGCVLLAVFGFGIAQARNGNYPDLIDKLIERFNLDRQEVEQFFEEIHEERMEQAQVYFDGRLDELVEQGKLTEEQKQLIIAKKEEMCQKMEQMKQLSPEERREAMEQHREEMKTWAEENGIELNYVFGHNGFPGNFDKGMKMGRLKFNQ